MREPYVLSMAESPFTSEVPPAERLAMLAKLAAIGADVVTDELGMLVSFLAEADVDAVLNDPRFVAVAMPTIEREGIVDGPLHDLWAQLMFGKDGDDHRRIRGVVAREFTPRVIERHRDAVRAIAERLCDGLADVDETDLWTTFAVPFAARVACHMVGIPDTDADRAAVWAFDLVRCFFPFITAEQVVAAERAASEFTAYVDALLDQKRAQPTDDIASRLVTTDIAEDLEPVEVRALTANLVFGGLEATSKGTSTAVFHLLAFGRMHEIAERPEIVDAAINELLRFLPPSQHLARLVPYDMVCQDVALRAGQMVTASLLAASRDPRRHDRPDELVFEREARQLAFGAGAHYCLGANLAKVALGEALTTLARRFPALALAVPADEVAWDHEGFVGVVSLPVRLR